MPLLDQFPLDRPLLYRSRTKARDRKERLSFRLELFSKKRVPNFFPGGRENVKTLPLPLARRRQTARNARTKGANFSESSSRSGFRGSCSSSIPLERHHFPGYIFPFRSVVRLYFHPALVSFPGSSKNVSPREIRAGKNDRSERNREGDAADSLAVRSARQRDFGVSVS